MLPHQLIRSLQGLPGFDEAAFVQAHAAAESITSVRFNPVKPQPDGMQVKAKVPWAEQGVYLQQRPSFTLDPLFHAGAYYVQEASSMFLEQALRQTLDLQRPIKVLDLCAAPGGKSTHIASLISPDSLLVSNEVIKNRNAVLCENITKWGADNVVVTQNDPDHFSRLRGFFDVIVVDAPCSGSGLFRKDHEAISEWSEDNVALCSQRQQRILADVLPALATGGVLIYSTCSYSKQEDEDIMLWLQSDMQLQGISLNTDAFPGIIATKADDATGYRFYPDKLHGEGFFLAAFTKPGQAEQATYRPHPMRIRSTDQRMEGILAQWFDAAGMHFVKEKEEWLAMPEAVAELLPRLQEHLYIRKAGVRMGKLIREELIPDHELAMSPKVAATIPRVELNLDDALRYLRRQDLQIDTPGKGWMLVSFCGTALGWIKALGNRINVHYPLHWRILK